MTANRRAKVERANVPLAYTEFLIQPFGPNGLSQLLNYDIIGFPEEGNQIELPSLQCGRGRMVSTPEQETEGFETTNPNQGYIWPLYPHSTQSIVLASALFRPHCILHLSPTQN